MPKVSIILPVYNVEKYISHCLDSIVSQSYADFEVIAVDDCSPDRSIAIVEDYAKHDDRIRIVKKEHSGLGLTRNKGLEEATGEFILFVDSDDFLSPKALEILVRKATESKCDIVFYNYFIENNKQVTSTIAPLPYNEDITEDEYNDEMFSELIGRANEGMFKNTPMLGGAWRRFFKRSLVTENNIKFENEQQILLEDNLFSIMLHSVAQKTHFITDALYHYRYNPNSLSTSYREGKFQMLKNYYELVSDYLVDVERYIFNKNRLDSWFVRFAVHESIMNILSPANKMKYNERFEQFELMVSDRIITYPEVKKFFKKAPIKDKLIVKLINFRYKRISYAIYRLYALLVYKR